jgi:hypothetical protein
MNFQTIFAIFACVFAINASITTRILKTPIFGISPCFGKHHAIIISDENNTSEVYLLDYTPITQIDKPVLMIQFKLLLGQTVPGEVRLRFIKNVTDNCDILKSPDICNIKDHIKSQQISNRVFKNIKQPEIRDIITTLSKKPDGGMNLYKYNCQHFCREIDNLYKK